MSIIKAYNIDALKNNSFTLYRLETTDIFFPKFADKTRAYPILETSRELSFDKSLFDAQFGNDSICSSLSDINKLNIIINDDDCMGEVANSICQQLDEDGIKYAFSSGSSNIDVDNSIVITLDHQYMAGTGILIFAPHENGRKGNSDVLALSMYSAFKHGGFEVENIVCGQFGFRENSDGTISERVPTKTEEIISVDNDTSFVTISFGTGNINNEAVAKAIEGALIRYNSYILNDHHNSDLIYSVENGETYDDIALKINASNEELISYNDTVDSTMLLFGEALFNPIIGQHKEFQDGVSTIFTSYENKIAKK